MYNRSMETIYLSLVHTGTGPEVPFHEIPSTSRSFCFKGVRKKISTEASTMALTPPPAVSGHMLTKKRSLLNLPTFPDIIYGYMQSFTYTELKFRSEVGSRKKKF